jgi:cobalamin biosynthesis protein CobD/CbiB
MTQSQLRVLYGFLLIVAGVVVAVVGYLGVSNETVVAFQLPYFASAGVGALMLMGGGAALLITAQMERDSARLDRLEEATRQLAGEVGRLIDELEGESESNGSFRRFESRKVPS